MDGCGGTSQAGTSAVAVPKALSGQAGCRRPLVLMLLAERFRCVYGGVRLMTAAARPVLDAPRGGSGTTGALFHV